MIPWSRVSFIVILDDAIQSSIVEARLVWCLGTGVNLCTYLFLFTLSSICSNYKKITIFCSSPCFLPALPGVLVCKFLQYLKLKIMWHGCLLHSVPTQKAPLINCLFSQTEQNLIWTPMYTWNVKYFSRYFALDYINVNIWMQHWGVWPGTWHACCASKMMHGQSVIFDSWWYVCGWDI